jgi:CRP-like cAMP-binding protein
MKAATHARGNALLSCLSPGSAFHASAEHLSLDDGFVVADPDQLIEFIYFPVTAVLSTLTVLSNHLAVETAVVGNEGMSPMAAFHGVERAPEPVIVQVPGDAVRISVSAFRDVAAADSGFAGALNRFAVALFSFVGQGSGCNRIHDIEQRCARWLMQTHDRVPGDTFRLTHLFLAQMLGVRRSSVTVAAESLRGAGAITYTRGMVSVTSRAKL